MGREQIPDNAPLLRFRLREMSPFTFPLINKTRTPASSLRARSKTHLRNLKERWQQGHFYLLDTAEMVDASYSTALAMDFLLRKPNRRLRGPARLVRPAVSVWI